MRKTNTYALGISSQSRSRGNLPMLCAVRRVLNAS